jgi:hypothetical protein
VVVNLRLETSETRRLGLDGHVCELQLILTAFAKLMVMAECALSLTRTRTRTNTALTTPPPPIPPHNTKQSERDREGGMGRDRGGERRKERGRERYIDR